MQLKWPETLAFQLIYVLYLWERRCLEDQQEAFPGKGKMKSKDDYIRKLELENKRLKDERDILKKSGNIIRKGAATKRHLDCIQTIFR